VVSDTSPIRPLHHLFQLPLLEEFFDEVLIPPAVARELEAPELHFVPIAITEMPRCRIEVPRDTAAIKVLETELQTGEAEATVVAHEHGAKLLIDERIGRRVARRLGIAYTGVIGLRVLAKQKRKIPHVLPLVLRAFVAEQLINIDLVDKTIGSLVTTAWDKYKVTFRDIRQKTPDPYLGEYFQWLSERIAETLKKNQRKPFFETHVSTRHRN